MAAAFYGRLTHGSGSTAGGLAATGHSWLRVTISGPVLTVSKRITAVSGPLGTRPVPGATITYQISVSNSGNANALNVRIFDNLPNYVTYVPGSITTGASFTTFTTNSPGPVSWIRWVATRLTNQTAAQKDSVTFKVRIN